MADDTRFRLTGLRLTGFKSIGNEAPELTFGDRTVLLGANGAGKSNLVTFFKMLGYLTTGALQQFVAEQGYADSLLHYGSRVTPALGAALTFSAAMVDDQYRFALAAAPDGALSFAQEEIVRGRPPGEPEAADFGVGHRESRLNERADAGGGSGRSLAALLHGCHAYQFHDTSKEARIRNQVYIEDHQSLRSDAGNLAAFLFAMQTNEATRKYYERIVRHIRQAFPQFGDFRLAPSRLNPKYILLNWTEEGSDYLFGPHQLSDGTLRFAALNALLMQPPDQLPRVIVIDEPELGLHPSAISALAGMVRAASQHCQVILATQSPRLVDEFEVEDVMIVERDEKLRSSVFRRLDPDELADWLERYCLSELWEKNVLGGQP